MTKLIAVLKTVRSDLNVEQTWFSSYERGPHTVVPAIYDQANNKLMQGEDAFDYVLSLMCQRPVSRPNMSATLYGAPSHNMAMPSNLAGPSTTNVPPALSASSSSQAANEIPSEFGENIKANERVLSPECLGKLFGRT
jgi:hypothetical protein